MITDLSKPIAVACDHAGFPLKNFVINELAALGYTVIDCGCNSLESCDYPDYASTACRKIQSGECGAGILICGTGVGMSIAANKHRGIRAACCSETFSARLTRMHNDANVLCIGARVIGEGIAGELIRDFVTTEFEGGRHVKRLEKVKNIEQG